MDLYNTEGKCNGSKTALLKVMDLNDMERKGNGPVVYFALNKIFSWLLKHNIYSYFLHVCVVDVDDGK